VGYDVKDRKLIVNEPEAATVRLIFKRYAELGSVALLRGELDRQDIVSKRREGAGGRLAGGKRFSRGALYLMLQNRTYRGEIVHQGTAYPGQHKAIIDPELWQIVHADALRRRATAAFAPCGPLRKPTVSKIFRSNVEPPTDMRGAYFLHKTP
jgi:site-specific DNA recombinase